MAWIESHDDIWEHHKLDHLQEKLGPFLPGLDVEEIRALIVGQLHSLWHFVLRNAWRDANLEKWGDIGIERAARWKKEPGAFVRALREVGFLDGYVAHGWMDRAGDLVWKRLEREKAKTRGGQGTVRGDTGGRSFPVREATVPDRTVPDRTIKDSLVPSPGALELAERLKGLILANNPKAKIPESLTIWAQDADRMIRLDKRTRQELEQVMDFCQRDSFLKANILSMAKLRKQFDQLWLKMNTGGDSGQQSNHNAGAARPIPGKYAHISKS